MPNIKSAKKRMRQNMKQRLRNLAHRRRLKNQVKKFRKAVAADNKDEVAHLLSPTISIIDKSLKYGILHKNAAARKKSRLMAAFNQISRAPEEG